MATIAPPSAAHLPLLRAAGSRTPARSARRSAGRASMRQANGLPRLRLGRQSARATGAAEGIDANARRAGNAEEVLVERRLDSRLTDHVPGRVARLPERLQLGRRDLPDVPEQLRRERSPCGYGGRSSGRASGPGTGGPLLQVRQHRRRRLRAYDDRVEHVARTPTSREDQPRHLTDVHARDRARAHGARRRGARRPSAGPTARARRR